MPNISLNRKITSHLVCFSFFVVVNDSLLLHQIKSDCQMFLSNKIFVCFWTTASQSPAESSTLIRFRNRSKHGFYYGDYLDMFYINSFISRVQTHRLHSCRFRFNTLSSGLYVTCNLNNF